MITIGKTLFTRKMQKMELLIGVTKKKLVFEIPNQLMYSNVISSGFI